LRPRCRRRGRKYLEPLSWIYYGNVMYTGV
jgi:hypothetical protein